jgi:hypothetical protein
VYSRSLLSIITCICLCYQTLAHSSIPSSLSSLPYQDTFAQYQALLAAAQPPEARPRLAAAFEHLMSGITMDGESKSKEKFTHQLTVFRTDISQFCVQPSV